MRDEFLYMQVQGPLSEFLLKLSPLDANFEYTGMQELARSISVVLSEHTFQVLIVFLLSLLIPFCKSSGQSFTSKAMIRLE